MRESRAGALTLSLSRRLAASSFLYCYPSFVKKEKPGSLSRPIRPEKAAAAMECEHRRLRLFISMHCLVVYRIVRAYSPSSSSCLPFQCRTDATEGRRKQTWSRLIIVFWRAGFLASERLKRPSYCCENEKRKREHNWAYENRPKLADYAFSCFYSPPARLNILALRASLV